VLPASAVPSATPPNAGLQSIIISRERRSAIINGQQVKIGDVVGDSTLAEIKEGSVVLQGAKGRQVLMLFPGVDIRKKETATPNSKEFANTVKKNPAARKRKAGKTADGSVQTKKNEGESK
jgi:hypothetical protein